MEEIEEEKDKKGLISKIIDIISSNNNEILMEINNKLESIIQDLNQKELDNIIKKIENIIDLINKIITLNKTNNKKLEDVIKSIKEIGIRVGWLYKGLDSFE